MRGREFRREKRMEKIKKRQTMAIDIAHHNDSSGILKNRHFAKLDEAIYGEKAGLFAKHDYGSITNGISRKTNVRKKQASYRHKGGYGKSMNYSAHDQRELNRAIDI